MAGGVAMAGDGLLRGAGAFGAAGPGKDASQVHHPSLYGIDLGRDLQGRRVLIADPSAFNRKTLARFLTWIGITDIVHAGDHGEVLGRLDELRPDLLLVDIDLGAIGGIETCRRLREHPRGGQLPVLLLTTAHSDQTRARCFQAGASDVITKPVNPGELIARIRYHLERRAMMRELTDFRERIERDLRLARSMQLGLIPDPDRVVAAGRERGFSIASYFESCDEIGGDFWSFYEIDERRLGFLVADFSGHGIAAAINAFRFHTLVSRCPPAELADPGGLLTKLNRELCQILAIGQYCTAFYGVLDRGARSLRYAAGAQPNPLLGDQRGEVATIDGSGVFLGFMADEVYDTRELTLAPEGFLLLYSDALTETPDQDGEMLGESGFTALVQDCAGAARPLELLLERFTAGRPDGFDDDLTAVWIAWS